MATETSNYKLKKIEKNDAILDSLKNISDNMDIIDEVLENKIDNNKNLVLGVGVHTIEVVSEYPETEVEGVLYIKTGA